MVNPLVPHSWGNEKTELRDTLKLPAAFRCIINPLAPILEGMDEGSGDAPDPGSILLHRNRTISPSGQSALSKPFRAIRSSMARCRSSSPPSLLSA
jgi:hypothetical protein